MLIYIRIFLFFSFSLFCFTFVFRIRHLHPSVILFIYPKRLVDWVSVYLAIFSRENLSTEKRLRKSSRWLPGSKSSWGRQAWFEKQSRESRLQPAHRLQRQINPSPHTPQASLGPPQIWPGPYKSVRCR